MRHGYTRTVRLRSGSRFEFTLSSRFPLPLAERLSFGELDPPDAHTTVHPHSTSTLRDDEVPALPWRGPGSSSEEKHASTRVHGAFSGTGPARAICSTLVRVKRTSHRVWHFRRHGAWRRAGWAADCGAARAPNAPRPVSHLPAPPRDHADRSRCVQLSQGCSAGELADVGHSH